MRQLRPLPGTPVKPGKLGRRRHVRRRRHPVFKSALLLLAVATPFGAAHEPVALRLAPPAVPPGQEAAARAAIPAQPARTASRAKASTLLFAEATPLPSYGLAAIGAPILRADLAPSMRQVARDPTPMPPLRVLAAAEPVPTPEPSIPLPPLDPDRSRTVRNLQLAEAPLPPERVIPTRKPEAARIASRPPIRNASIVASARTPSPKSFFEKLFGQSHQSIGPALAYAPTSEADEAMPGLVRRPRGFGNRTAIYNISAHVVIMPDGRRLEAHSGLGNRLDDPRYVAAKDRGPTPPNVYNLQLRRQLFHGVQAIRLNPENPSRMFGRDGILAHTYMLGPRGDSNGCVSFRDYRALLTAFLRGEVTRMIVVKDSSSLVAANISGREAL